MSAGFSGSASVVLWELGGKWLADVWVMRVSENEVNVFPVAVLSPLSWQV